MSTEDVIARVNAARGFGQVDSGHDGQIEVWAPNARGVLEARPSSRADAAALGVVPGAHASSMTAPGVTALATAGAPAGGTSDSSGGAAAAPFIAVFPGQRIGAAERLAHLPEVRAFLISLLDQAEEAHAPLSGIHEQETDLRDRKLTIERRIRDLRERPDYRWMDTTANVELEQRKLAIVDGDLDHAKERAERCTATWRGLRASVSNLERYLAGLPVGAVIAPFAGAAPELRKGETAIVAVERCRRRVRELDADLHRIETAPIPSAEAKALKNAELDNRISRGRPRCSPLIDHGEPVEWPSVALRSSGRDTVSAIDPVDILAWLFADQLRAKLDAEIDAVADDAAALSTEQRDQQRRQALRDKLTTERDEEAFVRMAIAGGALVMRRPEADPRAVLGLCDELPGRSEI